MKKLITIICLILGLIISGVATASADNTVANTQPKIAVFLAGAKGLSRSKEQLDEMYSRIPLFADAMHCELIPVEKSNGIVQDYVLDNKLEQGLSTSDLIALGDKLNADYIVYEQIYPNAVHGGGFFHPSARIDGDLTIRVFDVKEKKDVYTGSSAFYGKKVDELRAEILTICDKTIKVLQAMPYITSGK